MEIETKNVKEDIINEKTTETMPPSESLNKDLDIRQEREDLSLLTRKELETIAHELDKKVAELTARIDELTNPPPND